MDPNVSALERAFALAATGRFHKVSDIRLQLHKEGYNYEMVQGPVLTRQLVETMEQAHRRGSNSAGRSDMAVNNPAGNNARMGAAGKKKQVRRTPCGAPGIQVLED
jgi:hypothetical protein